MRLDRQEGRQSWADTMRASAAAVEGAHNWRGYLPDAWADRVEAPLWVEEFQEYQLDAQRWVGYDADEQPGAPIDDATTAGRGEVSRDD